MDMREILRILTEAEGIVAKIDRSAFIYLTPKAPKDKFAQCGSCGAFMPDAQRCSLFSKSFKVIAEGSCGLYVHGKPSDDQEPSNAVDPKEAGYIEAQVRCENCRSYVAGRCALFSRLNDLAPNTFDLDVKVDPKGCCNGWQSN